MANRSVSRPAHLRGVVGVRRRRHVRSPRPATARSSARGDRPPRSTPTPAASGLLTSSELGDLEQHLHRGRQPGRVPGQPGMPPCTVSLSTAASRLAQQLGGHQQVQQLQAVVDRLGLQVGDRGQPPLGCRAGAGPGRVPTSRTGPAPPPAAAGRAPPGPGLAHPRCRSISPPAPGSGRSAWRPLAPPLQVRIPRPIRHHHQVLQAHHLVRAGQARQRRVQLARWPLPGPAPPAAPASSPRAAAPRWPAATAPRRRRWPSAPGPYSTPATAPTARTPPRPRRTPAARRRP